MSNYDGQLSYLQEKKRTVFMCIADNVKKSYFSIFQKLYDKEKARCKKDRMMKNILKEYQKQLKGIASWDEAVLKKEFSRVKSAATSNIEQLITMYFRIENLMNGKPENYHLPSMTSFFKESLLHVARALWRNPYLMYDVGVQKNERIRNVLDVEKIIVKSIHKAFVQISINIYDFSFNIGDMNAVSKHGDSHCSANDDRTGSQRDSHKDMQRHLEHNTQNEINTINEDDTVLTDDAVSSHSVNSDNISNEEVNTNNQPEIADDADPSVSDDETADDESVDDESADGESADGESADDDSAHDSADESEAESLDDASTTEDGSADGSEDDSVYNDGGDGETNDKINLDDGVSTTDESSNEVNEAIDTIETPIVTESTVKVISYDRDKTEASNDNHLPVRPEEATTKLIDTQKPTIQQEVETHDRKSDRRNDRRSNRHNDRDTSSHRDSYKDIQESLNDNDTYVKVVNIDLSGKNTKHKPCFLEKKKLVKKRLFQQTHTTKTSGDSFF